jgi:hypothetical protein
MPSESSVPGTLSWTPSRSLACASMLSCELFLRSSLVLSKPDTDYIAVRGATGVGVGGRHAVSVTENVWRGAWCASCDRSTCAHIDAVAAARLAGEVPPLAQSWMEPASRRPTRGLAADGR